MTRLSDEELAAIDDQCDGLGMFALNPAAQRDVRAMVAEIRSLHAETERMRPVYEAAIEWSESFGELSKRLPPHVHKLRAAVDAATKGTP